MRLLVIFFVVGNLLATPLASFAQLPQDSLADLNKTALLLESIQSIITQLSGILSVPTASAACSSTNFLASADFSSTQGNCGWSYLYGNMPMTWAPSNPDGGGENTWKGNEQYLLLFSDEGHSGEYADAIRRWTSPSSGTVTISGTVSDTDTGGGDGVIVSIKKGSVILWGPTAINGAAGSSLPGTVSYNVSTSVSAGTAIDFIINKGPVNAWWDRTLFNPSITFSTAKPTPVAYLNYPGTTYVSVVQGQNFTLGVANLYPGHDVYYDQNSGPNGAVYDLGPIGTALSNGSFTKSFSTAPWPPGTYRLAVYTKSGTTRTSNNSNAITVVVTAPSTNYPPTVGNVSPVNSSSNVEEEIRFITTYSDQNGWQNLAASLLLVNTVISAPNSFYGFYNQTTNRFYLLNDAANMWLGGCTPGSGTIIENSYAKLLCSGSSAVGSGNNLTLTFAVTFKDIFAGEKNVYMYARDDQNLNSTWIKKGTWNIASTPSGNASPIGYLEEASCSIIRGWTCDADNFNQPLSVHLYADGPAGTGAFIGSTIANTYRGDLISANVCGGKPYHGFSFATPALVKNGRPHSIYAYGINIGGDASNTQLTGSSQKSVSCSYAAPSNSLKYFGFAGVGGDSVSVAETIPFSNAPHMGVAAGVDYTSVIRNVNLNGGRPIVGIHNIFFTNTQTAVSSPLPGTEWRNEVLGGYSATWKRRQGTTVFDGSYWRLGMPVVTGTLNPSISGSTVTIPTARFTDGNSCNYIGTLSSDKKTITGTYTCIYGGTRAWKVYIDTPPSGGVDWSLHPDYIARWNAFRATHASVLTPTNILALYMADEPTWNGISAGDLKIATDLVAASYPGIPRVVVESAKQVSDIIIPTSMSWVAFDWYGIHNPATDPYWQASYNTLKSRRSSADQKIFIIGDAWWGADWHGRNNISVHDIPGIALNYYNFAKNDPDVVALIGFLWGSFNEGIGARDLPASTRATYRLIGQSITGK